MTNTLDTLSNIYLERSHERATALFGELDNTTRGQVFFHVWDMAGQPPGDAQWGEHHAFDDLLRLSEAVKVVANVRFSAPTCPERIECDESNVLAREMRAAFMQEIDDWVRAAPFNEKRDFPALQFKKAYDNPRMFRIDLRDRYLTSLPEAIGKLTHIKLMLLSQTGLKALPESIGNMRSLERIHATQCALTTLPKSIGKLQNLRVLNLSLNRLESLPAEIGQLSSLTVINLNNNHLTSLPDEFANCTSLQHFYAEANHFDVFPECLGNCTSLQTLALGRCPMRSIPPSIGNLTGLITLNLDFNWLDELPDELVHLTALQTLRLNSCNLRSLPDCFAGMQNLELLSMYNNQLQTIPDSVLQLPSRCSVNVERNPINNTVRDRIIEQVSAEGYSGPRIMYNMRHTAKATGKTLKENLGMLAELTGREPLEISSMSKPLQENLNRFLNRLCDVKVFQTEQTRAALAGAVLDSIQLASENKTFREGVFAPVLDDAATTCGDRVALAILHLEINQKVASCDRNDVHAMAQLLINGVWTLSLLEAQAQIQVAKLYFVDPIETFLAPVVKLKEHLKIPHSISDMLFFRCSGLNQRMLNEMATVVENHTQNEKLKCEFLIEQPAWIECLEATNADALAAIRAEKVQRAEDCDGTSEAYVAIENAYKASLIDLTRELLGLTPLEEEVAAETARAPAPRRRR